MFDDYIPRLKRRLNESWVPLGTNSRAASPRADSRTSARPDSQTSTRSDSRTSMRAGAMTNSRTDGITVARVEGPPNFLDPYPASEEESTKSLPPSYAHLRSIARPEIPSLLPGSRVSYGRPGAIMNATPRQSFVATSSNMASLEDIRHIEIAHHMHMANRLSSVPQYPVYLDSAQPSPTRRRQSARLDSTVSAGTTGVMLSVGQLPGSEPFQRVPSQQQSVALRDWRRVQSAAETSSPGRSRPDTASTPHTDARRKSPASAQSIRRCHSHHPPTTSWFDSTRSSLQGSVAHSSTASINGHVHASTQEFYHPPHLSHRQPIHNVQNEPARGNGRERSAHVRFADYGVGECDEPPPPPPKDGGNAYQAQQGRPKLKHSLSCLSLRPTRSLRRSKREKFCTFEKTAWSGESSKLPKSGCNRVTDAEKSSKEGASAHMGLQDSYGCAGFFGRSIPRLVAC